MEKLWRVLLVVFAFCAAGSYLLLMVLTAIFTDMNAAAEFILLVLPFILTAIIVCHWDHGEAAGIERSAPAFNGAGA